MVWLINTKFLLQMMPFSPSMHKPQAATFPWSAAAPVGRAPGPRQWVQLLSRAQLFSFVFLLSIPVFAVLRTVYFKCGYQIWGPDQLQVLNGCLEITVCSVFYYYYYYCRRYCYYYYYYYLMLLFASGSISSPFPGPELPPRQGICFAHPC